MTMMKRKQRPKRRKEFNIEDWTPKTTLGRMVKSKEITDMDQIIGRNLIIREPEIADALLPGLDEEVIGIGKAKRPFKRTQRMTDSGRRQKFFVMVAVGNKKGYVGIGIGKAWEYGPAITKAINAAKLNIISVPLACGSWECSCNAGHSLPFTVQGRSGSIRFKVLPAPKGTGHATNETAGVILRLAGLKDAWSQSKGRTKSRMNMVKAVFDSLKKASQMKGAIK